MTNILNFFLSFDKLMKEKLVKAFYWLALTAIFLTFGATMFDTIWLSPVAGLLRFIGFFVFLLLSIISLRLLCEAAIALFRINDNLSPDGGKGETADVDLLHEARRAAETAAVKAREAAKTATEKTKSATKSALDKTKEAAEDFSEKTSETVKATAANVKRSVSGEDITIEPAKVEPPKPVAKPVSKTRAKKPADGTSKPRLKKDGTPAKRPGPKPKA